MRRTLPDARRWMRQGTALLLREAHLGDEMLNGPCALPGWTRRHLIAHVAANADALGNLVHWAATGEPTPMYASPRERAAGIENGAKLPAGELAGWLRRSADMLGEAMARLPTEQWQVLVRTAQGRTVPAAEVPWMRSREVWIHAADLATGLSFADLPADFLAALCDDVIAKRGAQPRQALILTATDTGGSWELPGNGTAAAISLPGPLAEVAAYLTGRGHQLTTVDGGAAPDLAPWL
ncbi:MAG: maleylpyruvate isomerase family mycothiol-dependent enzyme [Acidimicrobiia bacterium]|nr:maleylpyruvate isomerase family mycothiol-dependent enzyme [Acidimicrobiia bacterium]